MSGVRKGTPASDPCATREDGTLRMPIDRLVARAAAEPPPAGAFDLTDYEIQQRDLEREGRRSQIRPQDGSA